MRVPIYVQTEILTEPSMYPYSGNFDVLCVGEHSSVRCSGQISPELSFQDAYFMARYVESRIRKIIKIALSYTDVEDFFHHFWTGFINSNLTLDEDSKNLDDDITNDLENMTPPNPPAAVIGDKIISDYKQKINIVPYKEDIVSLVTNFLHGVVGAAQMKHGEDYLIETCVHRLKNHQKTYHLIRSMLEYHGIDYIPFNLDRDDYSDVFDLDTWLPLDKSMSDHNNVCTTMSEKKIKKLPQLIDKVLCLM